MPKIETPAPDGYEKVTLSNFGNGGMEELFQVALQKVLADIQDVNSKPDAKRGIDITIIFKPNEERREIVAAFQVREKIANARGAGTLLFTGNLKKDGRFVATEYNPRQMRLSESDVVAANKPTDRAADAPQEGKA